MDWTVYMWITIINTRTYSYCCTRVYFDHVECLLFTLNKHFAMNLHNIIIIDNLVCEIRRPYDKLCDYYVHVEEDYDVHAGEKFRSLSENMAYTLH